MSFDISDIIMMVVAFVLSILVGKFGRRVTRFLALIDSITNALQDNKITATELSLIVKKFKELISKTP